jgi:tetratricopeptide (TPR) repeat protein
MDMSYLFRIIVLFYFCSFIFSSEILSQTSTELVQTGLASYQSGDYEGALTSFNSALQTSGTDVNSDVPLTSESQIQTNTESQEVDDGESKMEYDEESQETYTGESQLQNADVSNIQEYSDPLNYQGDDPADLYLYRGQTYLKLGDKESALQDFDKAISLDPSYSDAYFRRAIANYQVNPDKVCPDLQTAIDKEHQSAQELYNLICK